MISQILQQSLIPTFVIDDKHIITHWNTACERLTGEKANEMIGTNKQWRAFYRKKRPVMADFVVRNAPKETVMRYFSPLIQVSAVVNGAYEAEGFFPDHNGKERWLFTTASPLIDGQGNVIGALETLQDITTHKRTDDADARKKAYDCLPEREEELRNRKEFIEIILDNLPIGLAVSSLTDGVVQYMNTAFTQIYGWPKDVLGSFDAFLNLVYPDPKYRKTIKNRVIRDIATRDLSKMIWKNLLSTTQSGEQRVVNVRGIPLFEQNLIISTAQDITERHKASEALQFTRFSIDHANDMIYWVDPNGKIVDVNQTTCIKLGCSRDELLAMTVMEVNPSLTLDKFHEDWVSLRHCGMLRSETSHYCKLGRPIPVEIHCNHIEFSGKEYNCVIARDIAERKEFERLVSIQDKMGSLGRVAAGIAHEIRNPLSTINVYLSTLKRLFRGEDFDIAHLHSIKEAIDEMDTASHKIETVVKRVMDFSKPNQQQMRLINVNQCIRDAVDLSAVTLRKSGIMLELKLDENLPECYLNKLMIEQVVLNLITNAREELIESDGEKHIEIETFENMHDGQRYISITVADSGSGVSPDLRDKIFDPFFTTKHYGSGIGLSICHRIISDHSGFLNYLPSRWGGAMFVANFPITKGQKADDKIYDLHS